MILKWVCVLRMQSKQWSFVIFKIQEFKKIYTVFNDVIENRKSARVYILTKSQLSS